MQASQKRRISNMSNKLHHYHHHHPLQEAESHFLPQFRAADPEPCHNGGRFSAAKRSLLPYCTLESSSAATRGGCYNAYGNSASTVSFSPNGGSPLPDSAYGSPISGSCVTDDVSDLRYKLKEIESAMLGPDHHLSASGGYESPFQSGTGTSSALCHGNESWGRIADSISRGDVKQVLISCAKAVADDDLMMAQWLMDELRRMVSVSGQPMQRLGAYMLEGLVARLASSGSSICKALKCKEPASSELLSYMHILYELCPYFKFGYMSANGAIAEAMKDENRVHIVDFQIAQGSQWITLIQAFAARPGGPPHIRITGIDDSTSAYARGGGLNIVGRKLSKLAETFKVPFEFHAAAVSGSNVTLESLAIRPGEAVAVNFAFALHHMADESVSTQNHRDRLLRLAKGLSPRVVTLVEQESNNNTAPFLPRFAEALDYYAAMFESIDATPARDHRERISVEQHCLARELVNIIACEGAERVERHELLGKWRSRLGMAGFRPYPLSSLVNGTIKTLLQSYSNKYRLEERDGALYLGWMDRFLVTSSAWQ